MAKKSWLLQSSMYVLLAVGGYFGNEVFMNDYRFGDSEFLSSTVPSFFYYGLLSLLFGYVHRGRWWLAIFLSWGVLAVGIIYASTMIFSGFASYAVGFFDYLLPSAFCLIGGAAGKMLQARVLYGRNTK